MAKNVNSGDTLRTLVLRFQIDNFWMADGVGEGVNGRDNITFIRVLTELEVSGHIQPKISVEYIRSVKP